MKIKRKNIKQMDTILWKEESDCYANQAFKLHGGNIDSLIQAHQEFANEVKLVLDGIGTCPQSILDVGCAYGGGTKAFHDLYPDAKCEGIDPGPKSVRKAESLFSSPNVHFRVGYGHDLPFEDTVFDLVILCMVLQWIPRRMLIHTIGEIDRVLCASGVIALVDFLPKQSLCSYSRHNKKVLIFKDDYSCFFTVFPWLKEVYRSVKRIEDGPISSVGCP